MLLTVVVQHCRGTGASDGEFATFENEAADGADTGRPVLASGSPDRCRLFLKPVPGPC
jgi:hypothetical protein